MTGTGTAASTRPSTAVLNVVNHVHWDREWYRPHEQFRARLVELVERVCEQLETGAMRHFHLDGQTITVADVLEIRPDLEERIVALARAGQLTLGPWHVLSDNQLISGESIIRNLLAARRWGRRLGVDLAPVGYCPDIFGHPPDLPTILRGFGIETALVWRGAPQQHAVFRWRAPSGDELVALHQGYHEAAVLWDPELAQGRLTEFLALESERRPTGPWVLLNGGDHLMPHSLADQRPEIGADGVRLREATLAEHFATLHDTTLHDATGLPVVDGELRYPGGRLGFLLASTLSTRMPLKQANAAAQTLLERWAEPYLAMAELHTDADFTNERRLLTHAWELLIQNAAHDSVCGCSLDEVHRQTAVRYERVTQLGQYILSRALQRLGLDGRINKELARDTTEIAVLNPHGAAVTQGVIADLLTAPGRFPLEVLDPSGRPVPFDLETVGPVRAFEADLDLFPDNMEGVRHRLAFVAADVPPLGWATYRVRLGDVAPAQPGWEDGNTLTIGSQHIEVADDASVSATGPTGQTYSGLGRLVDGGDRGDTYNYDPPRPDPLVTPTLRTCRTRTTPTRGQIHLTASLELPRGLSDDRTGRSRETTPVTAEVTVTAWSGLPGLHWELHLDNTVTDHRLRVHFPVPGAPDTWSGDAHLSTVERPVGPPLGPLPTEPLHEALIGISPIQTLATAGSGTDRIAILVSGLPEAQGVRDDDGNTELAITLLRSVGWLSRPDLTTRTASAGPTYEVPEAQCQGPQCLGWTVRVGEATGMALARAAAEHRAPLRALQLGLDRPAPAASHSYLSVTGALLAATKPAEDGRRAVVRLVNPTSEPVDAELACDGSFSATAADLDETPHATMQRDARSCYRIAVKPYSAASVLLEQPPDASVSGSTSAGFRNPV
ncbi:MAG: hypothetical protein ACOH1Y_12765 [Propionicimonas sp.]